MLRNVSISLDECGGAVPEAPRRSDSTSIEGRRVGKCGLSGVSLAVTDPSEGKLFYQGKARLKPKPAACQLRRVSVQVCWHPPYIWLLMEVWFCYITFPKY